MRATCLTVTQENKYKKKTSWSIIYIMMSTQGHILWYNTDQIGSLVPVLEKSVVNLGQHALKQHA